MAYLNSQPLLNLPFRWYYRKCMNICLFFSGNIMNSGSKNAQSVGFDISYLPKMSNTKDRENKATLLHFLVEDVERNHPVISRKFCTAGQKISKTSENQILSYWSFHFTSFLIWIFKKFYAHCIENNFVKMNYYMFHTFRNFWIFLTKLCMLTTHLDVQSNKSKKA